MRRRRSLVPSQNPVSLAWRVSFIWGELKPRQRHTAQRRSAWLALFALTRAILKGGLPACSMLMRIEAWFDRW